MSRSFFCNVLLSDESPGPILLLTMAEYFAAHPPRINIEYAFVSLNYDVPDCIGGLVSLLPLGTCPADI